ncbi:hypothetical protein [Piscinibacter sakaiensis]|uniref:hypothetical protein n=1 Tax=Piscinibacter sakaiensis TaxID=1547922 RepID=UPI003AAC77C5
MKQIALCLNFLAMFGATWMLCMRASDWRTDRWEKTSRWMPLVFGAMAWLVALMWLGENLYPGNAKKSDEMIIAFVVGLPAGIIAYALIAWLSPGTAGANRLAANDPVVIPEGGPKTKSEWLLLDVRAIPTLLRWRKK